MKVTLLNHSRYRNHCASIHLQWCAAIEREQRRHLSDATDYDSLQKALDDYLDDEMCGLGYSADHDIKFHACLGKVEYQDPADVRTCDCGVPWKQARSNGCGHDEGCSKDREVNHG